MFGSPETTPGGRALKFYASVRIDIRRIQQIKHSGDIVGNRTRVKIKKNKVAAPFKECEFDIMFNQGISKTGEIIDIGTELGIIDKRGAFYRYGDDLLGQGRENAKLFLQSNRRRACRTFLILIEDQVRNCSRLRFAGAGGCGGGVGPLNLLAFDLIFLDESMIMRLNDAAAHNLVQQGLDSGIDSFASHLGKIHLPYNPEQHPPYSATPPR